MAVNLKPLQAICGMSSTGTGLLIFQAGVSVKKSSRAKSVKRTRKVYPRKSRAVNRPYLKPGVDEKYRPEYDEQAYRMSLLGYTIDELAAHFSVGNTTLYRWRAAHPSFDQAIKKGGPDFDSQVAESLGIRAVGFTHPEEKIFCTKDGDIVRANTTKYYAPDPVAAMMWLSNRQRGRWRHMSQLDVTNSDGSFAMFAQAMRRAHQVIDAEVHVLEEPAIPMRLEHTES